VTLMHVLSDLVKSRQLMRVSELEQDLACSQDHAKAIREIFPILEDPRILFDDKLRLVCLYALRYERENNQLGQLKAVLRGKAVSNVEVTACSIVDELLSYCGANVRSGDLFGNKNILSKMVTSVKSSVKGVDNIYTQHKPAITDNLLALSQGKMKVKSLPYLDAGGSKQQGRYRLVVVYIVGGVTYEELAAVEQFNGSNPAGLRVVIGGSSVHNSHTFITDVLKGSALFQQQQYQSHNTANGDDFS